MSDEGDVLHVMIIARASLVSADKFYVCFLRSCDLGLGLNILQLRQIEQEPWDADTAVEIFLKAMTLVMEPLRSTRIAGC